MAKTLTIAFTDEQWALLLEYFPVSIGGFDVYTGWTEALLAEAYQRAIAREVVTQMGFHNQTTTEFDSILTELDA